MTKNTDNAFLNIEKAAHTGAFGENSLLVPTDKQAIAGNYKLGRTLIHGLPVAIEQPRHSYRTGLDQSGKRWTSRLAAHYGYFEKTRGADGDAIDCFIGFYPQAEYAYVINQHVNGSFDEHKIMLCFMDEESARLAYSQSYDRGWTGLHDLTIASISQLKWWLKHGNHKNPLLPNQLPYEGLETMNQNVTWDNNANPHGMSLDKLLYEIRRADSGDNLLMDSVSMADILEDTESVMMLDALVTPYAKLQRKMDILKTIMERAGGTIKPEALQISDPFKQNGVAQVAAIFELSDGQTISIFFHNPDIDPKKITPTDELISWKWLLNRKDITVVVAPEKGVDLNVKVVAERIIKLAEKNSTAFKRANVNRAAKMQVIADIKTEIVSLEAELTQVQHELEVAKVEAEDRAAVKSSVDWDKAESLDSQDAIRALGVATIDEIGSENVYVLKDGKPYYFKPGSTDNYSVGEHDFSNDMAYTDEPVIEPETTIDPELTTTETENNEQANEQTEVTPEDETTGTEGVELAAIDSNFTDASGAVYRDKIAEFIKANYGDAPKILVIAKDEDGNVLSLKKTTEGGVKRAMNAASNGEEAGSVEAIQASNGEKYLKALGHTISSEFSVKLPSWINEDGTYMLDRGYSEGIATGEFFRGLKFTSLTNMRFNFSSGHTGYDIGFNEINGLIEKGLLKVSDGKEDFSEFAAEYGNSKGRIIATVLKETNGVTGEVTYDISGDGSNGGGYSYDEVIKKLLMDKKYNPSMKFLRGTDFLNIKNTDSNQNQANIDILQSIIDGQHDAIDLAELLDMIDKAATALIDAGLGDANDSIIGAAADKYAALDLLKYGN